MFTDRLQATLTLAIGSSSLSVPAGAVERIEVDARTWGFTATVGFWVSSEAGATDDVFTPFTSTDIAQATLTIANGRLALEGEAPTVATLVGFVTERRFEETTGKDIQGEPIIERLYTVMFSDAAQVFWKAHRPVQLHAKKAISDVIDANLVQGVTVEYAWPELEKPQEMVCVGLGVEAKASFYDFVVGVVSDLCGVIELDASAGKYRIAKEKATGATATDLDAESVASLRVRPPALVRNAAAVLNPFTEATAPKTDVTNTLAATGVRADAIEYTELAAKVTARAKLEGERLRQRDHHLDVTFSQLPPAFPVPGVLHTVEEGFSKALFAAGKTYRSIGLTLRAEALEGEADASKMEDEAAVLSMEVTARFEVSADPVGNLPPFERCSYPVLAEGKVLSASGEETDRTWHAQAGESDSIQRYRISIPLWGQTIVAPFVPFGESGHFFFPAYKNERVLVALDMTSAKIVSFLDWAGKLAGETQGNQLVMGKQDKSGTVMKHVYTDNSPVLTLIRTQAGDKQKLELSQGRFFLEVKEEQQQQQQQQQQSSETSSEETSQEQTEDTSQEQTSDATEEVVSTSEEDAGSEEKETGTTPQEDGDEPGVEEDLSGQVSGAKSDLTSALDED